MKETLTNPNEAESNFLAAATLLAENIRSTDGRADALKEIIAQYLEKNEVDFAAALADTIDDNFIRDHLLGNIAEKCAEIGDDEYALQLADAIEDYGFQAMANEKIALVKASKKEFEKAFEVAGNLSHTSDIFAEIAIQQAADGKENQALETVSRIEYHHSKVHALQTIALHLQRNGNAVKANELLTKAIDEAKEIELVEEKIQSLQTVAANYIDNKQFDKAIELLADILSIVETLESTHRSKFLMQLSIDFLRAGSIDLADRTLDLVSDKTHMASCLVHFATEYDSKGERDEAIEVLEEAYAILKSQHDKEVRDSNSRFGVLREIAIQFAVLDKPERAIEVALENFSQEERNFALLSIAKICVSREKDELAQQALNAIDDESARLAALISLSDEKKKEEKTEEALAFLKEAETLCESVPQLKVRAEVYRKLLWRFFDFQRMEKARELLLLNLQTINRILDQSHKAIALANLAGICEKLDLQPGETEKNILRGMVRKPVW